MKNRSMFHIAMVIFFLLVAIAVAKGPAPTHLMCELLEYAELTEITDKTPEFGWAVNSNLKADYQRAYQMIVASSKENLDKNFGDMFDSGKVKSDKSENVEYQGKALQPGHYYWQVRTWNKKNQPSLWSKPQKFTMAEFIFSSFDDCSWIWNGPLYSQGRGWQYFRKSFDIDCDQIDFALVQIFADDNFNCSVNGIQVHKDTICFGWNRHAYNLDIARYLKKGSNLIAIGVYNDEWTGGLIGKVVIKFKSGKSKIIYFDDSFKCSNKLAQGWDKTDFDDSGWKFAKLVGKYGIEPWKKAINIFDYPWQGRYPIVENIITATKFTKKADGHYYIDFGRDAFGTLKINFPKPIASEKIIEILLGEEKTENDFVKRDPYSKHVTFFQKQVKLTPGQTSLRLELPKHRPDHTIWMPEKIGGILPFRYCEIINCPVELDRSMVNQLSYNYQHDNSIGHFLCNNMDLFKVWDFCKYSFKATSFAGAYIDGQRERKPYEADAYINQLTGYCLDREYTLARQTIDFLFANPTFPTEWPMHMIFMVYEDYMHTANTELIEKYYDKLKIKTLLKLAREDGLISTKTGLVTQDFLHKDLGLYVDMMDVVDWPPSNDLRDDYDFVAVNTVINAFHYRCLVLMEKLALAINKTQDAKFFAERAALVKKSFNEVFFDKQRNIYIDGEGSTHAAMHANAYSLAFGLVPGKYKQNVGRYVTTRGDRFGVYGVQYILEGLYAAGFDDYAMSLMLSKKNHSWWHMLEVGSTITTEEWDYDPKKTICDWNHAWGSSLANVLPRQAAGIIPLEPGYKKFRFKPQLGILNSGVVVVPTIKGDIKCYYSYTPKSRIDFNLKIPVNTTAKVYVSKLGFDDPTVMIDEKAIKGKPQGDFIVFDNVGSGWHNFYRKNIDTFPKQILNEHADLSFYRDGIGNKKKIKTVADWQKRRTEILENMQKVMGPLPCRDNLPAFDMQITDRLKRTGYERLTVTFQADKDEPVYAYLYLPDDKSKKHAAMVVVHSTMGMGKKSVDGQAHRANRAYAKELAERGYVVIAPDYPPFGDYIGYDFEADRYQSGTMKGIFNHIRCVDLLQSLPEVDPERIGVIGHSLGGHNAAFLAAFDERIKVTISSCGWGPMQEEGVTDIEGWAQDGYMPLIETVYKSDPYLVPFDFHGVIAAIAPRAFFSNSPLHDDCFPYKPVKEAAKEFAKIYKLYGAENNMQIRYPECEHDFPVEVREEAYKFLDKKLKHKSQKTLLD